MNCLLFDRLGKSIVLTPEGERLLEYAHKMAQLETWKFPYKIAVSVFLCHYGITTRQLDNTETAMVMVTMKKLHINKHFSIRQYYPV